MVLGGSYSSDVPQRCRAHPPPCDCEVAERCNNESCLLSTFLSIQNAGKLQKVLLRARTIDRPRLPCWNSFGGR